MKGSSGRPVLFLSAEDEWFLSLTGSLRFNMLNWPSSASGAEHTATSKDTDTHSRPQQWLTGPPSACFVSGSKWFDKMQYHSEAWNGTIRWLRGLLCVSECSFMLLGCGNSSSHIQRISSDYFVWKLCFVHGEQSTTWWFTQTDNWKDRNRQRYLWATVKEYEKSPVFGKRNWSLASKVPL